MKSPMLRISAYLLGGGILLTWMEPPEGMLRVLLILALIVIVAYLDVYLVRRSSRAAKFSTKVVSLGDYRSQKIHRGGSMEGARERRRLQPVFTSTFQGEVEVLLQILRSEGLQPMMVTQNRGNEKIPAQYNIMLPEKDLRRGKPLIDLYLVKSAKTPS